MMLDNNLDRGMKKWQGLMLPEHVKLIRELSANENYIQQSLLDDWELQQIQEELEVAYKRQCMAEVTAWRKGKHIKYIGKISELDHRLNLLSIEGPFGEDRVPIVDVIKVQSMN